MIIVYLSIALAVVSLVYLGMSAVKTVKNINPPIQSLSKTAAGVHKKLEGVKKEADQLKKTADGFKERMEEGKESVSSVVDQVKASKDEVQSLFEMARTVPNPRMVNKVELSPGVKRANDRLLEFFSKWKQRRNKRKYGASS